MELRASIPSGPLEKKWERHRFEMKLVNPANKRKYTVIMIGSGLAGAGEPVRTVATPADLAAALARTRFRVSPTMLARGRAATASGRRRRPPAPAAG